MDPQNPESGVTASPAEPAVSAAPVQSTQPNGSEPVTNPGNGNEGQTVPFSRFQEVNDKARTAEEEAQNLRNEIEQLRSIQQQQPQNDDDLDPDVEKLLDSYAKKHGLVSQQELAAERSRLQVQQDVRDLESNPPVSGIAYDHKAVMAYAKENDLPITSKSALRAAYRDLNWDKIVEAERNRAIDGFKNNNNSGAEMPGSRGAVPPSEQDVSGRSPKERIKSRIGLARQKLTQ